MARTAIGWSQSPTINTANNPRKMNRPHDSTRLRKCWLAAAFLAFLQTTTMNAQQPPSAIAQEVPPGKIVRLARLQIDPAQLESYRAALTQEIATSVRVEPGVIALNAVVEKHDPTRITILEIYSNKEAYEAHLQTPHFKEYKTSTLHMVRSLELVEVEPVFLGTKAH